MKNYHLIPLALVAAFGAATLWAAEAEQTFTGKAMCAKCELQQAEKCTNALQVAGKDGKTTTSILVHSQVSKDFHGKICQGTLDGVTVTGSVKQEGDKQIITPSKISAK